MYATINVCKNIYIVSIGSIQKLHQQVSHHFELKGGGGYTFMIFSHKFNLIELKILKATRQNFCIVIT